MPLGRLSFFGSWHTFECLSRTDLLRTDVRTHGPASASRALKMQSSNCARGRAEKNPEMFHKASIGRIFLNYKQLHQKSKSLTTYRHRSNLCDMLITVYNFNCSTFRAYLVEYCPRRLNTPALSII